MIDRACSLVLAGVLAVAAVLYAVRSARRGPLRDERLDRHGGSVLLGKGAMEMGYWALAPLGRACAALGITANMVSWSALAFAVLAAVAVATGHFGVGALSAAVSGACDVLDGMVARRTGSASSAGEVLDAALDRYAELLFVGGLCVHYRGDLPMLLVALAALGGSFMVSYATAKAEALGVPAPRGAMRRAERSAYLVGAALLTSLAGVLAADLARLELPMRAALVLVAVVANVSAARSLRRIAKAVRKRGGRGACAEVL